ncbi:MAG: RNA polymerase sigma factor [Candidatus Aureabacteria bacterium]|nr:RNA polymerase sigma factor [Candidatus Auribacterota bacterium]
MEEIKCLNKEELEKVFVSYKDQLYGLIMSKVGNSHEAEDLFSKSFMKFFNYAQKKPINPNTVKSLLFKISINTVNDYFRRKKIIKFISIDNAVKEDTSNSFHDFFKDTRSSREIDEIDNKNLLKSVNLHASNLPSKQKDAFYLRFIEGLSFSDIADIQKTSISTVLSRVRYAVEKIKLDLKSEGLLEDL